MRRPSSMGGCWKRIPGIPGSLGRHKAFLMGPSYVQNLPTPLKVGQPCNQKLVEGLVPGLALLRATRSVSGYKGLRRVDNLR